MAPRSGSAGGFGYRRCAAVASTVALAGVLTVVAGAGVGRSVRSARTDSTGLISLSSPRVVVLKSRRVLHLLDGERLVRSYPVDLGTAPRGQKLLAGDDRTPEGRFRVVSKNAASSYHRFLGIDYPDREAVARGVAAGLISRGEAGRLQAALAAKRCPAWDTRLGGGIGIHGCRRGEDWTGGCIALANEHVEELFGVLRIGDPVLILP